MYEIYDYQSDLLLAEANLADSTKQGRRNEFQIAKGYRNMWTAWHKTTTFVLKHKSESRLIHIVGFQASKEDMGIFTYVSQEADADLQPWPGSFDSTPRDVHKS